MADLPGGTADLARGTADPPGRIADMPVSSVWDRVPIRMCLSLTISVPCTRVVDSGRDVRRSGISVDRAVDPSHMRLAGKPRG